MKSAIFLLCFLSVFVSAKDIYFQGGKMSLDELATTVSIETKKDIIISQSLKDKIVILRVNKIIPTSKLFSYFKALIQANGFALNKDHNFYIVSLVTDLVYYSHRFKYRNAVDFTVFAKKFKESCSLGKNLLVCDLLPKDYKIVSKMVASFDIPKPINPFLNKTVQIDMKILESNYDDLLTLQSSLTSSVQNSNVQNTLTLNNSLNFALNLFLHGATVANTASLNYVFDYLQKHGFSTVTNEPNIIVTNGYTTSIVTGGNQRVIASQTKSSDLTATTTTYTDFTSGLQLRVKATILDANSTKLDISFQNNDVVGGTAELPISSTQSYQTSIVVKTNQTIVLGGVLYNKISKQKYKVPFLGDIPIIGLPFNGVSNEKTKKVLTIFLTLKAFK
ncbi:MAG: hypothetical protein R3331_09230 [Sulfurospirillaceae bacterium]|nr:hypothetical protein [Sulfurospirillaceae bacterium]